MMQSWVGTSGFSYKEWKGSFYPEDLSDKEMLSYYSQQMSAVEINNTFYRMPKASLLDSWAEQVPEPFRFVLKASRKITHSKPLKEKSDEVSYLFETASTLGSRLGVILFQLPPYLRKNTELLESFLGLLPDDTRSAFEFRHRSWFEEDVYELLQAHGCALCIADSDPENVPPVVATADWGYLRLRREDYNGTDLQQWADRIRAQNWHEVFVFFKHEDEAAGPALAKSFSNLLASPK